MNGWRLVGLLSLVLMAMSLWLLAGHAGDVEGIRLVVRATARTSLVLFVMAFTASALVELIPSDATRWQRRNRRYLGVSFAVSHFIHLAAIVSLATLDRELFWKLTNIATIVLAGTAYLFIAAMTATSFDRTAAWLGPRKWRLLHLVGGWYIWISFATAIGKRVPLDPFYWPMAALVLAAAIVRLIAMYRRNRRRHRAPDRNVQAQSPPRGAWRARSAGVICRRSSTTRRIITSFTKIEPGRAGGR